MKINKYLIIIKLILFNYISGRSDNIKNEKVIIKFAKTEKISIKL